MSDHAGTPVKSPALRRALLGLSLLLLIGAAASGFMAWQARQQQAALPLPSHLVPLTDGAVWLSMNHQLWLLNRDGAVETRLDARQAGLPSLPLVWARLDPPPGATDDVNLDQLNAEGEPMLQIGPTQLIALLPGTRQAHVLGARTGRLQHRIMLQWPADLKEAAGQPTALAVHRDGRMAIGLGALGVVAVFDPQGGLLARSQPDSHAASRFETQGLWWDGEMLWSADAERHTLVQLRGSDLSVAHRLTLPQDAGQPNLTTVALAHPDAGIEAISPLATLVRLDRHLGEGRVTHVWADGLEKDENLGAGARPASIAWLGHSLLVAENRDIRLRRFDSDRQLLTDLGDPTVQQALTQLRQSRDHWIHRMLGWLGSAIGCTLLAIGLLAGLAWRTRRPRAAAVIDDEVSAMADHTSTDRGPSPSSFHLSSHSPSPSSASFLTKAEPSPPVSSAAISLPGWYPVLGDAFHQTSAWARCCQDNERLRETFMMGSGDIARWIVLSNRRLLAFKPEHGAQGWQLDKDWHRSDIATIALLPRDRLSWTQRRQMPSTDGAWLRLKTREGQSLEGVVQPLSTAERIHAIVSLTARPPDAA